MRGHTELPIARFTAKENAMIRVALSVVALTLGLISPAWPQQPQKVEITATDYALEPKQVRVKPGKVSFVVANKGERAHDFRIEGNGVNAKVDRFEKGNSSTLDVELPAGEYTMYCGTGQHRSRGMEGKVTVAP